VSFGQGGSSALAPLAIAVPIAVAAILQAASERLPRKVVDAVATATAAAVTGVAAALLAASAGGRVVTWSAGWLPHHGFSVGIVLVVDPVGAGVALVAAGLVTLALVFSWRYIEAAGGRYHALMLLFLAGLEGFSLTGDLFDMFVFFELMGAAAYALTGMKVEDPSSLQGAFNFGIVNSLGAYLSLMGIGLLYAHTGQLGLPQLGHALAGHRPDALVLGAFVLVMAGFLVKGAMAPLHFWLADAHAVAPAPVCLLFSGVMVPLGTYAAFRVYWTVFSGTLPPDDVGRAFVVLGTLTGVVGAVMCLGQRNFKRLLAFSTVAHVGLFLVALGTVDADGTAGAIVYVVGHAGAKGALFLLAGILLDRYGSVDEVNLHGRVRDLRVERWLLVAGGLALACLPPFGTALGKSLAEDAAGAAGYGWAPVLFVGVSALTGGAVLRFTARVGWGLGTPPIVESGTTTGDEERETQPLSRVPITMVIPVVVLLAGALAVGVVPGVGRAASAAAHLFVDGAGYRHQALSGAPTGAVSTAGSGWTTGGVLIGLLSAALAVGVAAAGIWSRAVRRRLPAVAVGAPALKVLRRLHSGHVGDYVAWMVVGVAALGGLVGLPLR